MSMCIYTQAYDGYIYLMDKVYLLTILIGRVRELPDTREHILMPQVCSSKFYSAELVARILENIS